MPELLMFNAFGMVSVEGNTITVILSAVESDSHHINRTLKGENERSFGISGQAVIAVNISPEGYTIHARELGEDHIAEHPKVQKVIKQAADWIAKSIE